MDNKLSIYVPQVPKIPLDPVVCALVAFLLVYGFVMIGSASMEIAVRTHADPFFLLTKHGLYLLASFIVSLVVISVPVRVWKKYDVLLLAFSLFMLLLVLLPGIGKEVNGATRWISLGPFSLQGSEFVKLFLMVYMAGYLARRKEEVERTFGGSAKPLFVLTLIVLMLLGQPDFGAAIVIIGAAVGMIFLAGIPYRFFLPLMVLFLSSFALIATLQPYRVARLTAFADPWEHQFDSGYQLTQALIAFGRGEWSGLGLGNSIQKLFFLPEAHTDFLFSIVAEELGFFGAGLVLVFFAGLVLRGITIGNAARVQNLHFHALLAYGLALIIGIQASVNLGVNLGILPTKGLTLPFMSYGGNSLIVSCSMISIILRVDYETRLSQLTKDKRGNRND